MKRVQKLLIGSSNIVIADVPDKADFYSDTANALVGAVGVFDMDTGASLDVATIGVTPPSRINIGVVCADSQGRRYIEESDILGLNDPTAYGLSPYAAPSARVRTVDVSAVVPVEGDVFEIFITDYNDYNYIVSPRRIYYEATAADVAAGDPSDAIKDGLIAAINADESIPNVEALSTGVDTFTITGVSVAGSGNPITNFRADYEILFNVGLGQNLFGIATVANTTEPDKGCGTFREVRKMEETMKGYKGYLNRVMYPTSVNIQYKSAFGTNYDLYTIEHKSPMYTETEGDVHFQISTTIAMTAGTGAALGTLLDAALDVLR